MKAALARNSTEELTPSADTNSLALQEVAAAVDRVSPGERFGEGDEPVARVPAEPASFPVTHLLWLSKNGDAEAENLLFRVIFGHLRQIAAAHLRKQGERAPLEPTELVNEAYLHAFGEKNRSFQNRTHFFAVAARAMRCILVDLARKRKAAKRDWGIQQSEFHDLPSPGGALCPEDFLSFEFALQKLAKFDPRAAQTMELKVFVGLTDEEIGQITGLCARTVKRDYRAGKVWLKAELDLGMNSRTQTASDSEEMER